MPQNWKPETFMLDLPSGRRAEVRLPQALNIITKSGQIPDALADIVFKQLADPSSAQNPDPKAMKVRKEDLPDLMKLVDRIVIASLVDPKVVAQDPVYEKGECLLVDILEADKQFIFSWVMAGGPEREAMKAFPEQSD